MRASAIFFIISGMMLLVMFMLNDIKFGFVSIWMFMLYRDILGGYG